MRAPSWSPVWLLLLNRAAEKDRGYLGKQVGRRIAFGLPLNHLSNRGRLPEHPILASRNEGALNPLHSESVVRGGRISRGTLRWLLQLQAWQTYGSCRHPAIQPMYRRFGPHLRHHG